MEKASVLEGAAISGGSPAADKHELACVGREGDGEMAVVQMQNEEEERVPRKAEMEMRNVELSMHMEHLAPESEAEEGSRRAGTLRYGRP